MIPFQDMTPEEFLKFAQEYLGWLSLSILGFIMSVTSFIIGLIAIFHSRYWLASLCLLSIYISGKIMKWAGKSAMKMLREYDIKK